MTHRRPLFSLEGSVALVTGAAHGLGASIARGLAEAGAAVALGDVDVPWAERRAEALRRDRYAALAVELDVTRAVSVAEALRTIERELGVVDVLVNNAGLKSGGLQKDWTAATLAAEAWQRMVDVNLTGVFTCCQVAYGPMAARGGGSIINLASIYGVVASRVGPGLPYSATKAGVIGLTRALAVEWAPSGIRVNALAPTHIEPREDDGVRSRFSEAQEAQIRWRTPLGRRGRQDEIVGPVVFLASDASALVTGHVLAVDGGWLAW